MAHLQPEHRPRRRRRSRYAAEIGGARDGDIARRTADGGRRRVEGASVESSAPIDY